MLFWFVLHDNVNQPQWYIYHLPTDPPSLSSSYLSRSSQTTGLGSLCYIATSHQLSVLHTVLYLCQCYFLHSSHSLLPWLCPQVCSLFLYLHFFPANRFMNTIFLDYKYIYIYVNILSFFSLSDLLQSVYQALVSSISLELTQMHSFLWIYNTPLYICTTTSLFIHLLMTI